MTEQSHSLTFENVFVGSDGPSFRYTGPKEQKLSKPRTDLEAFLKKTPLMILEEGSKGVYQQSPAWEVRELTANSSTGPQFEMILKLRDITVRAQGSNKKFAKQKAAVSYLQEAVKKGRKNDFFIPGNTEEEARKNVGLLAERSEETKKTVMDSRELAFKDVDRSIPTAARIPEESADQNWVGKLQEKSQKLKLDAPAYEDKVLENKSFLVTCTMCNQKSNGISTTKKTAKNIAAYLMWTKLSEVSDLDPSNFELELEEMEELENIKKMKDTVFAEKNKKLALEQLLSDKKRFSSFSTKFLHPSISTLGKHQILLEVQTTRPLSPDIDELQMGAEHTQTPDIIRATAAKERERKNLPDSSAKVFSGQGATEEEAVELACQSALIHFNTFNEHV